MHLPPDAEATAALDAALLAESLATQQGFLALSEVLANKRIVDREDLGKIAKSMSEALELPEVRGNIFVQQIQRNTDGFLAGLIARLTDH
jgi:hypothetical protein